MRYDLMIIGGGMSGLVAAVTAARRKLKCAVLEAENRVGKKILATGNGKCNLSNSDPEPWKRFNAPEFVRPVLERYGKERLKEFWLSVGIALRESDGRIFPYSLEASSVLNALRAEAQKLGVGIFTDNAVDKLEKGFKAGPVNADNVLLATGSGATTGRGSAFLAEGLGHKCTPIYPSLGPLITDKRNLKGLKGVRVPVTARAISYGKVMAECSGEIIFKDNGISGTAAFGLSTFLARAGYPDAEVELDFAPDFTYAELEELLEKIPPEGIVHKQIAMNVRQMSQGASGMARTLKKYVLTGVKQGSMSLAQVASGGLELKDFDPDTLESRLCRGFFAAGEVLDVDGECGGYNLTWATASGMAVGEHVRS